MSTPTTVLAGVMSRRGGVAPVRLLDVRDIQGNSYHWASQPIASAAALDITPVFTGTTPSWNAHLRIDNWDDTYLNWLISDGPWHLSRSTQTDTGELVIQNMSGNSLQRSMNQLITRSAFEGALFAFREWNKEALHAEFEMRGRLSIVGVDQSVAQFTCESLFNGSDYQALDVVSETCRWRYASTASGDTTNNPCKNTFATCRLTSKERFSAFINNFIDLQDFNATTTSSRDVNRHRKV